jgi:hypothetical protein
VGVNWPFGIHRVRAIPWHKSLKSQRSSFAVHRQSIVSKHIVLTVNLTVKSFAVFCF